MPKKGSVHKEGAKKRAPKRRAPGRVAKPATAEARTAPPAAEEPRRAPRPEPPPAAAALEPKRKRVSPYRGILALAGLFVVLAAGLNLAVRAVTYATRSNAPVTPSVERRKDLPEQVLRHHEFRFWTSVWTRIVPALDTRAFSLESEGALDLIPIPGALARRPSVEDLRPPRTNRYFFSPDKKRYVDLLSLYGEPDSTVTLYNALHDGSLRRLLFCGTPCRFDHAFWVSDDIVVVLGIAETGTVAGVSTECPAGGWRSCPGRLTLDLFDLAAGRRARYLSAPHVFSEDPFEGLLRQRWASGLTDAEKAVMLPNENVTLDAVIVSGPATDIAVVGADGVRRDVSFVAETAVRDHLDAEAPMSSLRPGAGVRLTGRASDGSFAAVAVRLLAPPTLFIVAPRDGGVVGVSFTVAGRADVPGGAITVDVVNERTGRVLHRDTVDVVSDPLEAGLFSADVAFPVSQVQEGDPLIVSASVPNDPSEPVSVRAIYAIVGP